MACYQRLENLLQVLSVAEDSSQFGTEAAPLEIRKVLSLVLTFSSFELGSCKLGLTHLHPLIEIICENENDPSRTRVEPTTSRFVL